MLAIIINSFSWLPSSVNLFKISYFFITFHLLKKGLFFLSVNVYQVLNDTQGLVPGLNSGLVYGEGKEDVSKKWDTEQSGEEP